MKATIRAIRIQRAIAKLDVPILTPDAKDTLGGSAFKFSRNKVLDLFALLTIAVSTLALWGMYEFFTIYPDLPAWVEIVAALAVIVLLLLMVGSVILMLANRSENKATSKEQLNTLKMAEGAMYWLITASQEEIEKEIETVNCKFTKIKTKNPSGKESIHFLPTCGRLELNHQWMIEFHARSHGEGTKWEVADFIKSNRVNITLRTGGLDSTASEYPYFEVEDKAVLQPQRTVSMSRRLIDSRLPYVERPRTAGGYQPTETGEVDNLYFGTYILLMYKIIERKDFSIERAVEEL